jgi:hypothetical protein
MEAAVVQFDVLLPHFPGDAEENHKNPVMKPVSKQRFEPGTSGIRRRSVNHWTTMIGSTGGAAEFSSPYNNIRNVDLYS